MELFILIIEERVVSKLNIKYIEEDVGSKMLNVYLMFSVEYQGWVTKKT
jgi:hypothetical protein